MITFTKSYYEFNKEMETKKQLKENRTSLINEVVVRKHIEDYEYFITMGRYVDGKLSPKEIKDLEEDIKSWELFGIISLVGMGVYDKDGVPTPILRKEISDIDKWDFNGGEHGERHISCFKVIQFSDDEDNEKLHKTIVDEYGENFKNIGEYYRTLHYQSMIYQINYR